MATSKASDDHDVETGARGPDPTEEEGRWRPLRLLLDAMDDDIARFYDERGAARAWCAAFRVPMRAPARSR